MLLRIVIFVLNLLYTPRPPATMLAPMAKTPLRRAATTMVNATSITKRDLFFIHEYYHYISLCTSVNVYSQ